MLDHALELTPDLDEARFERGLLLAARWATQLSVNPETTVESEELRARALAGLSVDVNQDEFLEVDRLFADEQRAWLQGDEPE